MDLEVLKKKISSYRTEGGCRISSNEDHAISFIEDHLISWIEDHVISSNEDHPIS